jgi:hypothetical protein
VLIAENTEKTKIELFCNFVEKKNGKIEFWTISSNKKLSSQHVYRWKVQALDPDWGGIQDERIENEINKKKKFLPHISNSSQLNWLSFGLDKQERLPVFESFQHSLPFLFLFVLFAQLSEIRTLNNFAEGSSARWMGLWDEDGRNCRNGCNARTSERIKFHQAFMNKHSSHLSVSFYKQNVATEQEQTFPCCRKLEMHFHSLVPCLNIASLLFTFIDVWVALLGYLLRNSKLDCADTHIFQANNKRESEFFCKLKTWHIQGCLRWWKSLDIFHSALNHLL